MDETYKITSDECVERGLDLTSLAIDEGSVDAVINIAVDLAVTRVLLLNDTFESESDIESALEESEDLQTAFKKLQFRIIYNLIFIGDNDPLDKSVEDIITGDLHWGKINGFQKRIYGFTR